MIERQSIPGIWSYTPPRFEDARGWFSETFNAEALREALGGVNLVQDNQSLSRAKGTLRGMHFQAPPKAQDKLVRVLKGAVQDVAVDLRRDSRSYGKFLSVILSAENGVQLFVPKGFAHGFLTLEPDTEVLYKVSEHYSREHEGGLAWNDSDVAIEWALPPQSITLAERDSLFPRLIDLPSVF